MEGFSLVAKKRMAFIRDIQNIQRSNIMKRIRSETILHYRQEELTHLIQSTEDSMTEEQLNSLCMYANQQWPKAVAHLGNLIIEGKIQPAQLESRTLKPGYHPYWLWLIEVMVQRQYCTLPLIEHCLTSISHVRSDTTVSHALSILYKITTSALHSPLFQDQKILHQIFSAALRPDSASAKAFLLIRELIKRSEQNIDSNLSEGSPLRLKLVCVLNHGSLSFNKKIKMMTYQIFEGLMAKGVYLVELGNVVLKMLANCGEVGCEQIMFGFLKSVVMRESNQHLIELIDKGLILELDSLNQCFEAEDDKDSKGALVSLSRELYERSLSFGHLSKGVQAELNKYSLLHFSNSVQFQ